MEDDITSSMTELSQDVQNICAKIALRPDALRRYILVSTEGSSFGPAWGGI